MRHVDELDRKGAYVDTLTRLDPVQRGFAQEFVLFQTPLHERERECSSVDWDLELRQQKRDSTNVVFMTVGENQCTDFPGVLFQIRKVGSYDINSKQFGIRKHHAGVDHNDVVAVA
jgi:hypothetical protein